MPIMITNSYYFASKKITTCYSDISNNQNMRYPQFANRFKEACVKANMPKAQTALGKKLGVSGPMIHAYRNGDKLPSTDKVSHIAKKLGVSIDWLLNGVKYPVLSDDEMELLSNYRQMTEDGRSYIRVIAGRDANYQRLASNNGPPIDQGARNNQDYLMRNFSSEADKYLIKSLTMARKYLEETHPEMSKTEINEAILTISDKPADSNNHKS